MNDLAPAKREVARAPGYLRPDDFLAFFRFVREKGYEKGRLPRFPQEPAELRYFCLCGGAFRL